MSLISSIGNLVKPIAQKLTGKPQGGGAAQKAPAPAAAPQNGLDGQDDTDVADEVKNLLAANPPTWQWILSAFVILAAGAAGSYFLWKGLKPADFVPSSNYATYAGLFIMALAIERILEPFSGLFLPATKTKKAASRATAARAKRALTAVAVSGPRAVVVPAGPGKKAAVAQRTAVQQTAVRRAAARKAAAVAQNEAAVAQTAHHRSQSARAVLMWATASVLAMLVCASLGIFLLRSAEAPSPAKTTASPAPSPARDPNRVLDLLVTGLVVGAGTKPLHDLITQIQTSSGSSKAKASSSTPAS